MKPRQRGEESFEEALELGEQFLVNGLVYRVEHGDDAARSSSCPRHIKTEIEHDADHFLVVFIELTSPVCPVESEDFIAVITYPSDGIKVLNAPERGLQAGLTREHRQEQPVFVGRIDLVQKGEIPADSIPAVVWLYPFYDVLSIWRHIRDFRSASFIEAFATFVGLDVTESELCLVDGKLCSLVRGGGSEERQLPNEVIEARAKVVSDVARYYAKSRRRGLSNLQAPDIISAIRVYLMAHAEWVRFQKSEHFAPKRVYVLRCPAQFCLGTVKGGHEVHLAYGKETANAEGTGDSDPEGGPC